MSSKRSSALHDPAHLTRSLAIDDGDNEFNLQIPQTCVGITKMNRAIARRVVPGRG
jgi:hypothetical protein